ncbi:uncharacterized protein LOC105278226 isoform X1 [Ooceraea biroi]|uniref:uncharacterized protein LOC105278226 isoform X1 n=1 Tax=Ooceraea biroi TaxID=2015173 RepID=UPI0005B8FA1E|nr:uncharacterized protein LOC105278226 isoform X1 [Ooceraea biroi]XP_011335465.1 uncharacterized protein LOC105278226 isoform X1 [Ooceraea biroi]XP_019886891.1 uncharacterized protein LOC105278226 isoform X1 [Ooceraea biroi]XP_026829154.1 uncharacterized protein LOC105278226 isoform X1 [Ooceraea biroi]
MSRMHGVKRVLVFCTVISIVPSALIIIPLYLRHIFYADVAYAVTESDIMEINDGISTIFCSGHTLRMNGTFNAFQMARRPEVTSYRKHIRLKKSMNLPDDTLEYWGFYLLKNATVSLSVCSRFQGASILVVKGEKNLHTCGLLEHNENKEQTSDMFVPGANRQVKIIYESDAQEIDSNEITTVRPVNKPSVSISSENPWENHSTVPVNRNDNEKAYTPTDEKYVEDLEMFYQTAASYIQKHTHDQQEVMNDGKRLRHMKHRKTKKRKTEQTRNDDDQAEEINEVQVDERKTRVEKLKRKLGSYPVDERDVLEWGGKFSEKIADQIPARRRAKRNWGLVKPPSLLDQGIKHGGNADKNFTSNSDEESSVSSFESDLFSCYDGAILLAHEFEPSDQCTNISYLLSGKRTQANHHVVENGYYYYIFYSDNDIVSNDIYALFDIYKPSFQYENVTKSCINQTECTFSLAPFSADRVIVEIPTRDGIEHDETDDVNVLISVCQPRMGIYIIFPMATLVVILTCAFL